MITTGKSPAEASRIAEQLVRYRKDYRAFAREQLKLVGQPFDFWPCQVPLVESIEKQFAERGMVRSVWLKARQCGGSTLAESFVSWRAMLWPHINALVLADEAERAKSLFEISRTFYDHLDDSIRPQGRYVTKRELVFENPSHATRAADPGLRSRIVVDSAHKKNIGLGSRHDVVHLSECARFPDPNFVLDGVIPSVHMVPGSMIIMESSAEMSGKWFRDFCNEARKGNLAPWVFEFVPWYLQPTYQVPLLPGERVEPTPDERAMMREHGLTLPHVKWMRIKLGELNYDWNLFRQSYPLDPDDCWVTADAQVLPSKNLRELRTQIKPPIRRCEVYPGPRVFDAPSGRLSIWKEPEPNKAYDIGVDVASGLGKDDDSADEDRDRSVACVLERGANEQVAEFSSRAMDSFELAQMLYWLGLYYNSAQIAVETNGIGGATNAQLAKIGYVNIYLWRYRDELVARYSRKTGWETNPRSKPWLVGFMTHSVVNNRVIIRSELLHRELESFVQTGVREWGGAAGAHDDHCFVPWTIIETESGKNRIEYIRKGDMVLGHDGVYHVVLAVGSHNVDEEIVELKPKGIPAWVRCTKEHPILVRKRRGSCPVRLYKPEWVKAEEIRAGDFAWVPKRPLSGVSGLSEQELYLLGWYLSDGNLTPNGQLKIVFARDEEKSALAIASILQDLTKKHPTIWVPGRGGRRSGGTSISVRMRETWIEVSCCNKWIASLLWYWIGPAKRKVIHPNLVKSKDSMPFIVGFLEGDGSQKNPRGAIAVSQKDLFVLESIRQMLLDHGVWVTSTNHADSHGVYSLNISGPSVNDMLDVWKGHKFQRVSRYLEHPIARPGIGGFWVPMERVGRSFYSGPVWNLSVEGSNSYTAAEVGVHNCIAWMIALLISDDENFERYYGLRKATDDQKIGRENLIYVPEPWEADLTFKKMKREDECAAWE